MAEQSQNQNKHQEILKEIIHELHAGVPVKKLQEKFAAIVENTSPEEIADMENALIKEGFPPEEIQRLCDVHVQVFEKSLSKTGKLSKIPGHPIHTFLQENKETQKQLKSLKRLIRTFKRDKESDQDKAKFETAWNRFKELEKHYQRKENQLFPELEAVHFTGPTQVMWGKHDEIRTLIKETEVFYKKGNWRDLASSFKSLESAVKKMIFLEEKILYPTASRKLTEITWAKIKSGEPEIGYAWIKPAGIYDSQIAKAIDGTSAIKPDALKSSQQFKSITLSVGNLAPEQIDWMLKVLPVDITYVDENDTVLYYSDSKHRIFPRSPGIIGRKVQNCHPPKSVHIVEEILQAFRDKSQNSAEFWIHMGEQFVHIEYFPVYNDSGEYKGVIEVSQEISHLQKLKGEKRLLDW